MFIEEREEHKFEWSQLGDIEKGRENLGPTTSVAVYRLMQYTLRDSAIRHTDVETTNRIFYDAGCSAGRAFHANLLAEAKDFNGFVGALQVLLKDLGIGILRVEAADFDKMEFTLTVAEDLDCSGLPMIDEAICTFDEGFIAGLLESQTGAVFNVKEVDCWCTGDRVCRFRAWATQPPP